MTTGVYVVQDPTGQWLAECCNHRCEDVSYANGPHTLIKADHRAQANAAAAKHRQALAAQPATREAQPACNASFHNALTTSFPHANRCAREAGHYDPADSREMPVRESWHQSSKVVGAPVEWIEWADWAEGASPHTETPQPAPASSDTRTDESWQVMFRMERSDEWLEWSNSVRTPGDAVRAAEPLAALPVVGEIRFDRITVHRDRFSLHDLAQLTQESPS